MKHNQKRVILEPELEAVAGGLTAWERVGMARKLERWAHQLRVSAAVLRAAPPRATPPRLPRLNAKEARQN